MASEYDEFLTENPFFNLLKTDYFNIYQYVAAQSWTLCIPRSDSFDISTFSENDILSHVLMPSEELPEFHYVNLIHNQVTVCNKVLTVHLFARSLQKRILFEEIFYTEDNEKFKLWCIDGPLICNVSCTAEVPKLGFLSFNDALDYIWSATNESNVIKIVDETAKNHFSKINGSDVAQLAETIEMVLSHCIGKIFRNRCLREKIEKFKDVKKTFHAAIKTYLQYIFYDKIMFHISSMTINKDSKFNKTTRNLSGITLEGLKIRKELYDSISNSRLSLKGIGQLKTAAEKVHCLKTTINALKDKICPNVSLTLDDILPALAYLVICSDCPNWNAQLEYIKTFRVNGSTSCNTDETSFLVTTLEAVLEYIQLLKIERMHSSSFTDFSSLEPDKSKIMTKESSQMEVKSSKYFSELNKSMFALFKLIANNSTKEVCAVMIENQKLNEMSKRTLLNQVAQSYNGVGDDNGGRLCHPLCTCINCAVIILNELHISNPTALMSDSQGFTVLHIACIYGRTLVAEMALQLGADVNAKNLNKWTPLHFAAFHGHQETVLLLIHCNADINSKNIDKNTPLHLATYNGHLNCVKALVYFSECSNEKLYVNSLNKYGNAPIHLAAKWGYMGITNTLIASGAEPSLLNKDNKSAFDVATNYKILAILNKSIPNLAEYIHISDLNIKTKLEIETAIISRNKKEDIDKIFKAISYRDIKLACFYLCLDCENTNKNFSYNPSEPINLNMTNSNGTTALMMSSKYGLSELVEKLLKNGANINLIDSDGQTALHHAVINNQQETVECLLQYLPNLNLTNKSGNTPLHEACYKENIKLIKAILACNPNTTIRNNEGKKSFDILMYIEI